MHTVPIPNTNKLAQVTQGGNPLLSYEYNAIGQMKRQTEGSVDRKIIYNACGLVKEIRDQATDRLILAYTYDSRGNRSVKTLYDHTQGSNPVISITWYVHDASGNVLTVYGTTDEEAGIMSTEIPIYGAGRIGVHKVEQDITYYEVSDHLACPP